MTEHDGSTTVLAEPEPEPEPEPGPVAPPRRRSRTRSVLGRVCTVLAFCLVWFALVLPDRLVQFDATFLLRVPVEGLVLVGLGLFLPRRIRTVVALLAGTLLGVIVILKLLDIGYNYELDRPFDLVDDRHSFGPAIGVLQDSIGHVWGIVVVCLLVALAVALVVAVALATLRVSRTTAAHRGASARITAVVGVAWVVCAVVGAQLVPDAPVASISAAAVAVDDIRAVQHARADQQTFSQQVGSSDPYATTPTSTLLSGLRGKDVLVVFVESYGQSAVRGSSFAPGVDAVLRSGTAHLTQSGFSSRSAFLTSPTFGGISWLAHSTLQSGLWVDSQQRYDQLVASNRFTLSDAFSRAGWRTVGDVPSNRTDWPEGTSFYHYDTVYDHRNLGYRGPAYGYADMPDQYILSALQRDELTGPHAPVMAEIDLVSSHTPWTNIPSMVPWEKVGDGSIFDGQAADAPTKTQLWSNSSAVQASYGRSIQYTMSALVSFLTTFRDPNLVVLMLGDHQPSTNVSGANATHNVPISIVTRDPGVLSRVSGWHWQNGLLPGRFAPLWPMSSFRNKFLDAFDG